MWSETVGHRTGPVGNQKSVLVLQAVVMVLLVWCCETRSCHARRHNDIEDTATFQVLFIVSQFSLSLSLSVLTATNAGEPAFFTGRISCRPTNSVSILCLEYHCGDQQWRSLT